MPATINNPNDLPEKPGVYLLKDFQDEIPGYLNNNRIYEQLKMLDLKSGQENIDDNLRLCYEKLVDMKLVDKQELKLLDEWISECNQR